MQALDTLLDRASVSALQEPGPDAEVLDRILETALRAPDHGKLRPWRLVLIRGDARTRLADVVADAMVAREPDATADAVEKQRGKFLRPPLVIALGAHILKDHKIPVAEQMMSVAAATMNLLNAIHAEGFGAIWVTGASSYDTTVQHALGFTDPDCLAGFLFVGTPKTAQTPGRRAPLSDHVTEWTGL